VEYGAALDEQERQHHRLWARRSKEDPSYARPLVGPPAARSGRDAM
jgi:hypothetical protein